MTDKICFDNISIFEFVLVSTKGKKNQEALRGTLEKINKIKNIKT